MRHSLLALRDAVRDAVVDELDLRRGQRIVDLGCGDCPYRPWFVDAGCLYIRCDIEGDVDITLKPGEAVPLPDGSANGVVSFQVLEHVSDLDWYLSEVQRILIPGGWFLLSTHGVWLYHPHPADYWRWTRDGLLLELETRGFAVASIRGLVRPLAWTTQFRLFGVREALRRIPLLGRALLAPIAFAANVRMVVEDAITPARIKQQNACVYLAIAYKEPRSR